MTIPSDREVAYAPSTAPGKGRVIIAWVVSAVAALLVDTAAVIGALQVIEFRTAQLEIAAPEGASTPSPGPPDPIPSSTATAPPRDPRVPIACEGLYSDDMISTLTALGLELQSAATNTRYLQPGTTDAPLRELLEPGEVLECAWLDNAGGDQSGVLTVISTVNEAETEATIARLTALKMTRLNELGGVRFYRETTESSGRATGESHFLREGLWFATRWYGQGPYGYTGNMVRTVFQ